MEKSKRAIIYARVSTDDQRKNYSIPTQIAECVSYLDHKGYSLVGDRYVEPETGMDSNQGNGAIPAYVDDFSSRELNRPSLNSAFSFLETFGADVVIIHSLDRLARDPYIRQTLENEFEALEAHVEFAVGSYDQTPEGEVRKDLDATFAKWENAKRVERCNRGKKGKANRGLFVSGRAPYGYYYDVDELGGLGVNERQAETIRHIFDLFVHERYSIRAIVKNLNNSSDTKPYSGGNWAKSTIHRLLKNTTYIGKAYYNKHKRENRKLISRDRGEWIEIPVIPILNENLFLEAQRILEHNRKVKRKQPKREYFLSGMIVCDECGKAYHCQTSIAGSNGKTRDDPNYRHRKAVGHCLNRQISARILDAQVWEKVTELLLDPKNLYAGYHQALEQEQSSQHRQRALHAELINSSCDLQAHEAVGK